MDLEQQRSFMDLVNHGHTNKFLTLTVAEINEYLGDLLTETKLEEVILILEKYGIQVSDSPEQMVSEGVGDEAPILSSGRSSTTDPTQQYMEAMGKFPLLTQSEEIELAKRIEEGQQECLAACAQYAENISDLVNDFAQKPSEVIGGFYDQFTPVYDKPEERIDEGFSEGDENALSDSSDDTEQKR
jgi:RNA polymerase primary sigma factor